MAKTSKLNRKTARLVLVVVWAGATIAAGIGAGLLINARNQPVATTEQPLPVATSDVAVDSASATAQIVRAQSFNSDALQTTLSSYQTSDNADALQPGFQHFGQAQGTKGTDAVKEP